MNINIDHARDQFPAIRIADGGRRRIYLDAPGGTQVPERVLDRMREQLVRANANCGGAFVSSREVDALSAAAHAAAADLLGAEGGDSIVFGQSMTALTFALSRSLAREFERGDEIILSRTDHDGNVAPWLAIARDHGLVVRWAEMKPGSFMLDLDYFASLVGPRTRLAAVGHASNFTGAVNDIAAIAKLLKPSGALLYVDGVQFVPHHKADVAALGCDFYVCSAYKFFGPHLAVLWGRPELLRRLTAYRVRPAGDDLPGKFEVGTPSYEGQAGVLGAIEFIASLGGEGSSPPPAGAARRAALETAMRGVGAHEAALCARLLEGLREFDGVTVLVPPDGYPRVPLVSLVVDRRPSDELAAALAERNVFAWSGNFYAHEIGRTLDLPPGGALRFGLTLYNTVDDVVEALAALREAIVTAKAVGALAR